MVGYFACRLTCFAGCFDCLGFVLLILHAFGLAWVTCLVIWLCIEFVCLVVVWIALF